MVDISELVRRMDTPSESCTLPILSRRA